MARRRSADHTAAQRKGRERDRHTCQICGAKTHVEGHHIIDYWFNGAALVDNIVTLCHKHHRDVHDGKINIIKI